MLFTQVDPETFINLSTKQPRNGRGAWARAGIDFEYRYKVNPATADRIGSVAEKSLDHWAVAAGSYAIQRRLVTLGHMAPLSPSEVGLFGPRTTEAVKAFQAEHADPQNDKALVVDGIVGTSDARALFAPLAHGFENQYGIPDHLLTGQTNHESMFDPGAVGFFIYYGDTLDYRGVDRGLSQFNSKARADVSWRQAYDQAFSLEEAAQDLKNRFVSYRKTYPNQRLTVLWDAAVCAHNSPVNGNKWAKSGQAPTEQAASYVSGVKNSSF